MIVVVLEEPSSGVASVCVTVSGISGTVETPFSVDLNVTDETGKNMYI